MLGLKFKCKTKELVILHIKVFFLNVITLGLYYPYGLSRLTNFYLSNTYNDENVKFTYNGDPIDLLTIYVRCIILSIVTLGVYSMTTQSRMLEYIVNHISFKDAEGTTFTAQKIKYHHFKYFWYLLGQKMLVLLTLGFYGPYARLKMMEYRSTRYYKFENLDDDNEKYKVIKLNRQTEEVDSVVINYFIYSTLSLFTLGLFSFPAYKYNYKNFISLYNIAEGKKPRICHKK